jgi:L-ascorbate metabolism protein UlaG (beta-lactamase superfamily)
MSDVIELPPHPSGPGRDGTGGTGTGGPEDLLFVGNATVLVRCAGFTVLTDPNFLHRGERAYLGNGLWSKRLKDPAVELDALPPSDVVVLSHLHGDHFDRVARRGLDRRVPIVTTRHAVRRLRPQGFDARPLDTWGSLELRRGATSLRVTALPGRHAPGPAQALLPPVMGSLLEFRRSAGDEPLRLYLSGDTLVHDDLREIRRRQPELDLAVLHLGGTRVLGLLVTMDGAQGVELLQMLRPRRAVPVHYDDYGVFTSPLSDFQAAVAAAPDLETAVTYLDRGGRTGLRE